MPMYNLIEYSDNYQDSSATLYQYKQDEPPEADPIADLTANNSSSFKYKINLLGDRNVVGGIVRLNLKVVVPLKYLSNFFRSLEMPLINCKIKLNLTRKKECVLSTDIDNAVFIINDTKLYVPVVTLSKGENKDFIEQQNKGFQRSIYWNEYKTKSQNKDLDANVFKYINLDPSFQGINRLCAMAYNNTENDNQATRNDQRKYYLPRIDLKNTNSLIPFHPLTNIEISEYYSNEPRFNGVYLRDNLPKTIKKGAYIINLDEYENTGSHWIALFLKTNEAIYFDSFGIEHIPNEINKFIGNKNIISNIFRIQAYDSIMCRYFCIECINYMPKGKTLLDYTNLFSPNDFKKNDRVIKRTFKK